jgi:hypothetical protein
MSHVFLSIVLAAALGLQKTPFAVPAPVQAAPNRYVAPFTLMPRPPKLPKVDLNSCPFEGCQFGNWTATRKVVVYSGWNSTRKPIATLRNREKVEALTGVNVVLRPGKGTFGRDVPLYGAKKGDIVYAYQNCGEGAADIWVHGRFIKCADLNFSWRAEQGCRNNCGGRWLSLVQSEWWVQVRLPGGTTGWVRVDGNFKGLDALE